MHDFTPNPKGSRPNREALHEGDSGNVVRLHPTTQGQADGAGLSTTIMASRYGLAPESARQLGVQAKELVEKDGYTAGHARSVMLRKVLDFVRQPAVA